MTRYLVVTVAAVALLANIPGMATACVLLAESICIHMFGMTYFEYPYLLVGGVCLVLSGVGIVAAGMAIAKGGRYRLMSVGSLVMGLIGVFLLPDIEPKGRMGNASMALFQDANRRIYAWGAEHGRYPASEQELRDSLGHKLLSDPAIYLRRGRAIPYNVRFATRTEGPLISSVPPDPGIIDYCVSLDSKEFFLRMTTLQKPVGENVVFDHLPRHEEAWVITGKLPLSETESKRDEQVPSSYVSTITERLELTSQP